MPPSRRSDPSSSFPVRSVVRFLLGSVAAWIYLALVIASIAVVAVTTALDPGDPGFAAIWPLLATAPWSMVMIGSVPDTAPSAVVIGALVLSLLANLVSIGALMHVIRRPPTRRTPPLPFA